MPEKERFSQDFKEMNMDLCMIGMLAVSFALVIALAVWCDAQLDKE